MSEHSALPRRRIAAAVTRPSFVKPVFARNLSSSQPAASSAFVGFLSTNPLRASSMALRSRDAIVASGMILELQSVLPNPLIMSILSKGRATRLSPWRLYAKPL